MQRKVISAIAALVLAVTALGSAAAHPWDDRGLDRADGIADGASYTSGPEASGKVNFQDIIVSSGKPIDTGDSS